MHFFKNACYQRQLKWLLLYCATVTVPHIDNQITELTAEEITTTCVCLCRLCTVKIAFDLTCQSSRARVFTTRGGHRTDLTVLTSKKGMTIERMEWEAKGWESGECGAWSAVGGCERDYGTVVRGWLSCRGRAESIKSNVWWRYNEMNLCRAVMLEYLATLFWFCSWPSRHPSRYTVFELNSTTGRSLQKIGRIPSR